MYVPQTSGPGVGAVVEFVELLHERGLIEQVKHLSAVEFYSIDEIDGIIGGGRQVWIWTSSITLPVPPEVIQCTIE